MDIHLASIFPLVVLGPYPFLAVRQTGKGKPALKNPCTGHTREAPVGYSWTVVFFGPSPPLLRRDWAGALIIVVVGVVTLGLAFLVSPFICNRTHLKRLVGDGFKVESTDGDIERVSRFLSLKLPMLEVGQ